MRVATVHLKLCQMHAIKRACVTKGIMTLIELETLDKSSENKILT